VLDTAQILLGRDLNDDEFSDLALLGWMIELFQAFMLVHDDIMDGSLTRRGRLCWYKLPEVGLTSVNDGVLLESIIFLLLKKHFRTHANYIGLIELFQETAFRTELGQASDMLVAPETARWGEDGQRLDLARYNLKRYSTIVKFKTSYYSFYTPIALALLYTGKASLGNLSKTENITLALGEYFQIQDDYLDCFGNPAVLGKIGMDIQDNKCTWLVCQALMRCSIAQRKVIDLNYGIHNADAEIAVKKLYADMQLTQVYHEYEDAAVAQIQRSITSLDERDGLRRTVFEEFLRKIHRRDK
jgi:farnesyl diphosphate synthase